MKREIGLQVTQAIIGIGLFSLIVVLFHLLRPDLDPLRRTISEYAVGRYSFLMTIGFIALAAGSLALCLALARGLPPDARSRASLILLALWSLGCFLVSIFPTDLINTPITLHGLIHGFAAITAFLSLCISAIVMSRAFKRSDQWRPYARPALLTGIVLVILLVVFLFTPDPFRGLTERIFVGACIAWLIWLALKLRNSVYTASFASR